MLPGDDLVVALPHRHRGEHRTSGFGITEASAAALAAAPRVAIAAGETHTSNGEDLCFEIRERIGPQLISVARLPAGWNASS